MSTQPSTAPNPILNDEVSEQRLSYDEWWILVESLFGTAKDAYAEVGGAEAFMRAERAAWDEDNLR